MYEDCINKGLIDAINLSPYFQLLGITVEYANNGCARLKMKVKDDLFNLGGVIHGGAIASIADSAVGIALAATNTKNPNKLATIELKINYFMPVIEGEIIAEANIVFKGNQIAVGDVEVKDQEDRLIAKGIATYIVH